jgi:hypothetical protein
MASPTSTPTPLYPSKEDAPLKNDMRPTPWITPKPRFDLKQKKSKISSLFLSKAMTDQVRYSTALDLQYSETRMQPAPPLPEDLFHRSEFVSVADSIHSLLQDCDSLCSVSALSLAGSSWVSAGFGITRLRQQQQQFGVSMSSSSLSFQSPIEALQISHQEQGARLVSVLESNLISLYQFKHSTISNSPPTSPRSSLSFTGSESELTLSPRRVACGFASETSSPMASSTMSPIFFGESLNLWLLQPKPIIQSSISVFSISSVERLHDLLECADRLGALSHLFTNVLPSHLMKELFSHIISGDATLSETSTADFRSTSLELSFVPSIQIAMKEAPSPLFIAKQVVIFANHLKTQLGITNREHTEQAKIPFPPAAGGGVNAIKRLASPRIHRTSSSSRKNGQSKIGNLSSSSNPTVSEPQPQHRLLNIVERSYGFLGSGIWCGRNLDITRASDKVIGVGNQLAEMVIKSMPQSLDHLQGWLDNVIQPIGNIELELLNMGFLAEYKSVGTQKPLPFQSLLAAIPTIYATRAREEVLRSARESCNLPLGTSLIMSNVGEKGSAADFILVLTTPTIAKRYASKLPNTSSLVPLSSNSHESIDFHAAVTRLLPMQVSTATLHLTKLVRETTGAASLASSAGYSILSQNFILAAREVVGIFLAVMSSQMLTPSSTIEPSTTLPVDAMRRGVLFHNDCLLMAHILARLSLPQGNDNSMVDFSDLIPSLQIAARESLSLEMMRKSLIEVTQSDLDVSICHEGPTNRIKKLADQLQAIGKMLAEVLSRSIFIRIFGTLADSCIVNTCKESFEEIRTSLSCFDSSGARGERSNVISSLRISSNIRLLLDTSSNLLCLDSSNPPTLFIKSWDRAKALKMVLSLPLLKVREKALSGFFSKQTLRAGLPCMTKEEVAMILTFRFSPALGQKGIQLELKNLG